MFNCRLGVAHLDTVGVALMPEQVARKRISASGEFHVTLSEAKGPGPHASIRSA